MTNIRFLLILCAFACSAAKSQMPKLTEQDSALNTATRIDLIIQKFGLNSSLYTMEALPEFYLIACFTDSKGNLEHIELFSTDSAAHRHHYQTRVLPLIYKEWQPIESKYSGMIIPVLILQAGHDPKKAQQYQELSAFFSIIQRKNLNKGKMFLARTVMLSYYLD